MKVSKPATLGRPTKSAKTVTKEKIYQAAFQLLKGGGLDALTFRALAKRLDVTPMAITHHVGTRKKLLAALIESVFSGVCTQSDEEAPQTRLQFRLSFYCDCAVENADLIQAMLSDSSLISGELVKFTGLIRQDLSAFVDRETVAPVLNLIIDYTHGFVISTAAAPAGHGPSREEYTASLNWILGQL